VARHEGGLQIKGEGVLHREGTTRTNQPTKNGLIEGGPRKMEGSRAQLRGNGGNRFRGDEDRFLGGGNSPLWTNDD